jgi:hypothetical protein
MYNRRAPITCHPSLGLGSENSGHDIDESPEVRTSSYLVTRFRDRGLELRVGDSLESQLRGATVLGKARPGSSRIQPRGR